MMFKFYGMLLLGISCLFSCNAQNIPTTDNIDTLAKLLNIKYYEEDNGDRVEKIWFDENGLRTNLEVFEKEKGITSHKEDYKYNKQGLLINKSGFSFDTFEFFYNYDTKGRMTFKLHLRNNDTIRLEKWRYNELDSLAMYSISKRKEKTITTDYIYYADSRTLEKEITSQKDKDGVSETIKNYSKQRKLVKEEILKDVDYKITKTYDYLPNNKLKLFEEKIVKGTKVFSIEKMTYCECGVLSDYYEIDKKVIRNKKITYNDKCNITSNIYTDIQQKDGNVLLYEEDFIYDNYKLINHTLKVSDLDTKIEYVTFYEILSYNDRGQCLKHTIYYDASDAVMTYGVAFLRPRESIWYSSTTAEFENVYTYDDKGRLIKSVEGSNKNKVIYEYTDTSTIKKSKSGMLIEIYNLDSTYHQIIELEEFTDDIKIDLGNGKHTYEEVEGIDTSEIEIKILNDKKELIYKEFFKKQHNTDVSSEKINFTYYNDGDLKSISSNSYYKSFRSYGQNTKTDYKITYGEQGEVLEYEYVTKDLYNDTLITNKKYIYTYDFSIRPFLHKSLLSEKYILSQEEASFAQRFKDYNLSNNKNSINNRIYPITKIEKSDYESVKGSSTEKKSYTQIQILYNQNGQVLSINSSIKGKYKSKDKTLEIPNELLKYNYFDNINNEYDKKGMLIKSTKNKKQYDYRTQKTELVENIVTWTYEYYD